jgi:hypothetical protein
MEFNMDGIERRHTDRLKILGANVVYTLNGWHRKKTYRSS